MTIADIFNSIVNYNLDNFGKDFVSPLVQVGGFLLVVLIALMVIGCALLLIFTFVEHFRVQRQAKAGDNQLVKSIKKELNLDKHSWKKVSNQQGLYCYCCTKKLPIQSWENQGNYYCDECWEKFSN